MNAMTNSDLTASQREAVKNLVDYNPNPDNLHQGCLLDHGRHSIKLVTNLGTLKKLPHELHYEIICHLDVQSLLVFRRVSKKAMDTVNTMVEYKKVIDNAPDTMRMAVGIKTAHTFTIKQLFNKLCQKMCDGGCHRAAPYIDMYRLTRTCLCVGGLPHCVGSYNVIKQIAQKQIDLKQPASNDWTIIPPTAVDHRTPQSYLSMVLACYNVSDMLALLHSLKPSDYRGSVATGVSLPHSLWENTAVFAPWLSKNGFHVEFGVFCDLCKETEIAKAKSMDAQYPSRLGMRMRMAEIPNPVLIPFCTIEGLVKHKRDVHGQ